MRRRTFLGLAGAGLLAGLAAAFALVDSGYLATLFYRGDGRFVDHGFSEATSRYVIDFGIVDLGNRGRYRYRLAGLPRETMTLGLELFAPSATIQRRDAHAAVLKLKLVDRQGNLVIDEAAPLDEWVWNSSRGPSATSFLYRVGKKKEREVGGGVSTSEHVGVRASGGWGSFFDARITGRYELTLEVLEPIGGETRYQARLLARGGGWKS